MAQLCSSTTPHHHHHPKVQTGFVLRRCMVSRFGLKTEISTHSDRCWTRLRAAHLVGTVKSPRVSSMAKSACSRRRQPRTVAKGFSEKGDVFKHLTRRRQPRTVAIWFSAQFSPNQANSVRFTSIRLDSDPIRFNSTWFWVGKHILGLLRWTLKLPFQFHRRPGL